MKNSAVLATWGYYLSTRFPVSSLCIPRGFLELLRLLRDTQAKTDIKV